LGFAALATYKNSQKLASSQYKIFLLAVNVGLHRKEIDLLEWSSFRWDNCLIRIQATEWFHPKSEESLADLPVEPEVMELFRRYHTRGTTSEHYVDSRFRATPGLGRLLAAQS
jgi:hypothetical protein